MREVISINVGQAGVQLSNAAWELFCIEHGILANGALKEYLLDDDSNAFETFFQEIPGGQFVPRAISIDLEPTVLDEVRTGAYRNLWHPDQLISGFEDAANNYARGHFTLGKQLIDETVDAIRKAVDMCSMLQGFLILDSLGGGTGSGFASLVLERLGVEYTKRLKFQLTIVPSANLSSSVVDPYNSVLSMNAATEHSEICSMFDNEAVNRICCSTLDIVRPTYNNLNRVISQVMSSLTVSLRFESSLNADLDQIITNIVPYPRIHFPSMNYAPIISIRRAEHETLTCQELTRTIFEKGSQMICANMLEAKFMSCCVQFRGDITPKQVNNAVFEIKRRTDIKFVNWCPTGFKLGINCQPPTTVPSSEMAASSRSVMMLTNSTAICQIWDSFCRKFDILFSKRSFVHWYVGEGMEEGEFNEAKDEMNTLMQDYLEVAVEEEEEEEEDANVNLTAPPPPPPPPPADNTEDQPETGTEEGAEETGEANEGEAAEEAESAVEAEAEDEEVDEDEDDEGDENETETEENEEMSMVYG